MKFIFKPKQVDGGEWDDEKYWIVNDGTICPKGESLAALAENTKKAVREVYGVNDPEIIWRM